MVSTSAPPRTASFEVQRLSKASTILAIAAPFFDRVLDAGFLTNAREEAQLRKPDYRQKLAEALYRGVSRYADSLSHFQLAANQE